MQGGAEIGSVTPSIFGDPQTIKGEFGRIFFFCRFGQLSRAAWCTLGAFGTKGLPRDVMFAVIATLKLSSAGQ